MKRKRPKIRLKKKGRLEVWRSRIDQRIGSLISGENACVVRKMSWERLDRRKGERCGGLCREGSPTTEEDRVLKWRGSESTNSKLLLTRKTRGKRPERDYSNHFRGEKKMGYHLPQLESGKVTNHLSIQSWIHWGCT